VEAASQRNVALTRIGRPVQLSRLSDEALARRAAAGDGQAFAALYERYQQPLYGYCRSIVRNEGDAQDVLQSTLAGALSALQRHQRTAPVRPWLFRIAHNEAISLIRRRARDGNRGPINVRELTEPSAEEHVAGRARWAQLTADLAELPDRLRAALLLRELAGLSHDEIAAALGSTSGAAKQAIFEARQSLVELAEGRAMQCEDVCRRISDGDGRVLRGRRIRAHLRDCGACQAFAAGIRTREADMRAFIPLLPTTAAATVLTRAISAGSSHGPIASASAASTAPSAAVAASVGKVAGAAVAWKTLVGAAVITTATAGVAGLALVMPHHRDAHRVPAYIHAVRAGAHPAQVGVGRPATSPKMDRHPAPGQARGRRQHSTTPGRAPGQVRGKHRHSGSTTLSSPSLVSSSGSARGRRVVAGTLRRPGSGSARLPKAARAHTHPAKPHRSASHTTHGHVQPKGKGSTRASKHPDRRAKPGTTGSGAALHAHGTAVPGNTLAPGEPSRTKSPAWQSG
jgi:RNA polymerase sigma factor (sigma-70 family)